MEQQTGISIMAVDISVSFLHADRHVLWTLTFGYRLDILLKYKYIPPFISSWTSA